MVCRIKMQMDPLYPFELEIWETYQQAIAGGRLILKCPDLPGPFQNSLLVSSQSESCEHSDREYVTH